MRISALSDISLVHTTLIDGELVKYIEIFVESVDSNASENLKKELSYLVRCEKLGKT